ncbi:uncharacterized protein VP01_64g5 [Puccinia sorghi]|uniref:Uncharacterized protein n=1 Tax=Puccinia sorghi TaxID=27349 RepID=A0A0L6UFK1_9BASI|nr:uncharacterized protein VP01_64g5 [Puccinia sorghi]
MNTEYNFASNVSDINGWAYGILSYINKETGKPIFHLLSVIWDMTSYFQDTLTAWILPTPPSLQHRDKNFWTHFGCLFQINKSTRPKTKHNAKFHVKTCQVTCSQIANRKQLALITFLGEEGCTGMVICEV